MQQFGVLAVRQGSIALCAAASPRRSQHHPGNSLIFASASP